MVPVFTRSTGILINTWLHPLFTFHSALSLPIPLAIDTLGIPLPCNFVLPFPEPATRLTLKLPFNEPSTLPFLPSCDYPTQPSLYPSPTLDPSFSLGVQVSLPLQQYVHPSPLEQLLPPFPTVLLPSPTGLPATTTSVLRPSTVTMSSSTVKPPSHVMKTTLHDNPSQHMLEWADEIVNTAALIGPTLHVHGSAYMVASDYKWGTMR